MLRLSNHFSFSQEPQNGFAALSKRFGQSATGPGRANPSEARRHAGADASRGIRPCIRARLSQRLTSRYGIKQGRFRLARPDAQEGPLESAKPTEAPGCACEARYSIKLGI